MAKRGLDATNEYVTALVVSDLHAYDTVEDGKDQPSFLRVAETMNPGQNLFRSLERYVDATQLQADLVLCPGDLGDCAKPEAIQYAWSELAKLQSLVGAKQLIATVGNHDIDSRHHRSNDARGFLQTLTPNFPIARLATCNHFWAKHFALIESQDFRILVLDTSAFQAELPAEKSHGRVSLWTIEEIKRALVNSSKRNVNILLCHHHLFPLGFLFDPEYQAKYGYESTADGDKLVQLLASGDYGHWMILHGHKHVPHLGYAQGYAEPPIVFSAGSFAAVPYLSNQANQFYIVKFLKAGYYGGMAGYFESLTFVPGLGWEPTSGTSLPAKGGFGFHGKLEELAERISAFVDNKRTRWAAIATGIPGCNYVLPKDLRRLFEILREKHKLSATTQDGDIYELCPTLETVTP